MKNSIRLTIILVAIIMFGCGPKKLTTEDIIKEKEAIKSLISDFWKAYEQKDASAMLKFFSTSPELLWFGTDSTEVINTIDQWETQMKNDWQLFEKVSFGELRNLSILIDDYGELASALYEAGLDMTIEGKQSHALMRGSNVLVKENGEWRFIQGMLAFASVGQSSAELMEKMKEEKEKKK